MKRSVVLLFFLLLAVVAIFGIGNNAFAAHGSPFSPEVAILQCSVSGTPPAFMVTAASSTDPNVTININDDCAKDLVLLKEAGLVIRDVQTLNNAVVYTLVNGLRMPFQK